LEAFFQRMNAASLPKLQWGEGSHTLSRKERTESLKVG
jgi:hypothetical protein